MSEVYDNHETQMGIASEENDAMARQTRRWNAALVVLLQGLTRDIGDLRERVANLEKSSK